MRRVLRDALALAIALNRTLVMPRMLCYCDNIWKEMKHCRVGGAFGMTLPFDCPADHILNLPAWFDGSLPIDNWVAWAFSSTYFTCLVPGIGTKLGS